MSKAVKNYCKKELQQLGVSDEEFNRYVSIAKDIAKDIYNQGVKGIIFASNIPEVLNEKSN